MCLKEKLVKAFQEYKNPTTEFTIYWGDDENDWITIKDDAGLLIALKGMAGRGYQLHITSRPTIMSRQYSFAPLGIIVSLIKKLFK